MSSVRIAPRFAPVAALLALLPVAAPAQQNRFCAQVAGATLVAQDAQGTVLGNVTDRFDPESIFNEYGRFGSRYGTDSIWNSRGTFGSPYSGFSPFNENTATPPRLVKGGQAIGVLTTNARMRSAVSPDVLRTLCLREVLPRSKASSHALSAPIETPLVSGAREPAVGAGAAPGAASSSGVPACVRVCSSVPATQFTTCLDRCEAGAAGSPASPSSSRAGSGAATAGGAARPPGASGSRAPK